VIDGHEHAVVQHADGQTLGVRRPGHVRLSRRRDGSGRRRREAQDRSCRLADLVHLGDPSSATNCALTRSSCRDAMFAGRRGPPARRSSLPAGRGSSRCRRPEHPATAVRHSAVRPRVLLGAAGSVSG
jgi:hypothetical protein